jgi:hypothetical protein
MKFVAGVGQNEVFTLTPIRRDGRGSKRTLFEITIKY